MKKYIALTLGLALAASAVAASDLLKPKGRKHCGEATRHVPAADVHYKEGASADGWAVAPADMPRETSPLEEAAKNPGIKLEIPLTSELGSPGAYNADLSEHKITLGTVEVKDGKALMNGKPLEGELEPCH